jgi:hypothetical protein
MSAGLGAIVNTPSSYPTADKGVVVVWGLLGSYPFGGMTWQVLHYVVGMRLLGFDVWYVEDSDRYVYDAVDFQRTKECASNIEYVKRFMEAVGLGDRWVFRLPREGVQCAGALDYQGLLELYRSADAVFNLCGAQEIRQDHERINCRVYLETDPVESQVRVANGDSDKIEELTNYDFLFTYGERLGKPGCRIPLTKFEWHTTRPPVLLEWWESGREPGARARMTSIAKWAHSGKDVVWEGEIWRWSKHHEFLKVLGVARESPLEIELAVSAITTEDLARLNMAGWFTIQTEHLRDPFAYRDYICDSLGEFTVAKEQYVKPDSGWFSDRSVCYLAAGRPVVTQATGFEKVIPTGVGVVAFHDLAEARRAIESIAGNYEAHSTAAQEIAREHFSCDVVLRDMMTTIGLL